MSRGYSWILAIGATGYSLFDYTDTQCVESERGTSAEFDAGFERLTHTRKDEIRLRVRHDITAYVFQRIAALPENTLLLDAPRQCDPTANFDFFCDAFTRDYAFFELRNVDWAIACASARSSVTASSTPDELFATLHTLIDPLADNHVMLSDGKRRVTSEKFSKVKAILREHLGLKDTGIGDPANISRIVSFIRSEFLDDRGKVAGNGAFVWGEAAPDIGYLGILRLFGIADTSEARTADDLPPRRPDHAAFLRADLDALRPILDRIFHDLADAKAIVLDIRVNGGGFDNVGMAIANRFADQRRLAFTKQARTGSTHSGKQEFYIEPERDDPFTRPVYVLTSPRTASAGDIFALCMRCLPHATLVGQATTGILSDNLKKHMPNGWVFSLSNELYCSPDGELFEGAGIPVDVATPVFVAGDFLAGYHCAVDKAIELAGEFMSARTSNVES